MSPDEPTVDWFHRLAALLGSQFDVISLSDALARAESRQLSGRTLSITFDDGYADNYTVALPVLEAFRLPATFFVASGFIDGGRMWNDTIIETVRRLAPGAYDLGLPDSVPITIADWPSRREAAARLITGWKHLPPDERQRNVDQLAARVTGLPDDLMMNSTQLRSLAQSRYATIGGHTRNHPILASLGDAAAIDEIEAGRRDLEGLVQRDVDLFAYPNGKIDRDYRPVHAEMVRKAGFRAAVSTDWGTMDASTDRYAIPRFTPWHRNFTRFIVDLARCHHRMI